MYEPCPFIENYDPFEGCPQHPLHQRLSATQSFGSVRSSFEGPFVNLRHSVGSKKEIQGQMTRNDYISSASEHKL